MVALPVLCRLYTINEEGPERLPRAVMLGKRPGGVYDNRGGFVAGLPVDPNPVGEWNGWSCVCR